MFLLDRKHGRYSLRAGGDRPLLWRSDDRAKIDSTAPAKASMMLIRRPLSLPTHKGFGTHVIAAMIQAQMGGDMQLDWRTEGLVCEIALPSVMCQTGA